MASVDDKVSFIPRWWPVALSLAAIVTFAIEVDAQTDTNARDIKELREKGSPVVAERLARMEAKQDAVKEQLDRIERKLP